MYFNCPFCGKTVYINKFQILCFMIIGKNLKMRCDNCCHVWFIKLFLKTYIHFKPQSLVKDTTIYKNP